ncbi:MAG: aldehyde dehydrogenase [Candidatus Marinimicrobia bacterium]|nr:aldehyde dehydrogenase [Candidatus Neomarinimicrobiota bacterium]|tara:strand:+ start:70691 stop:72166 length:1476 start_codon:yes stop_codon:yes gene_type:complete
MIYKNFINNKWFDAKSGKTFDVINPFTEDIIAQVPASNDLDINNAVKAAKTAFKHWRSLTPGERRDILRSLAEKSRDNAEPIAKTISAEMGKPYKDALSEINDLAEYLEYYSELARDQIGRIVAPVEQKSMSLVKHEPFGVVGCIIPWNYPLSLMGWKLAPALAAGNTIVMKPSEISSLSILHWAELAGGDMPPGVMNIVTGFGQDAGEPLVKHHHVPIITFTGSVQTGKRIAKIAADNLKKVSLELGGKDPVIVCDDVDIEVAAKGTAWGGFVNSGQVCTSVERVYVYDSVIDNFTDALIEETNKVKLGDPMDPNTDIGPMASQSQLNNTIEKVNMAKKQGCRVLAGGKRSDKFSKGYFFEPTVFDKINKSMEIVTEESFSPVIPIQKIHSLDEAIEMANSTKYGLGCTIFTKDMERALRASDKIKSGTVCINSPLMENIAAPFGGMKQSGIGREHGVEALLEFQETKHIFIDYNYKNKDWWFGKRINNE